MGVTTTADEKLENIRSNISESVKDLREFLDPDTHGHEDYQQSYVEELEEVYLDLCKIKKKLK